MTDSLQRVGNCVPLVFAKIFHLPLVIRKKLCYNAKHDAEFCFGDVVGADRKLEYANKLRRNRLGRTAIFYRRPVNRVENYRRTYTVAVLPKGECACRSTDRIGVATMLPRQYSDAPLSSEGLPRFFFACRSHLESVISCCVLG